MKKKQRRSRTPKKNALVKIQSPVHPDLQFYVASEQADDEIIEKEILGQVLPTFIYQFPDKTTGKMIKGLSLNGVRETVRRINRSSKSGSKIRISPEHPVINRDVEQNGQKGVEVMVYAEDLQTGSGQWGMKFEPYMKVGRNGAYPNKFALEVALSKAQRNAMRALIPEKLAVETIAKLIGEPDAVKTIEAPKAEQVAVVPQATSNGKLYAASLKRVQQIAADRPALVKALANIRKLRISDDQKANLKGQIEQCLISLK